MYNACFTFIDTIDTSKDELERIVSSGGYGAKTHSVIIRDLRPRPADHGVIDRHHVPCLSIRFTFRLRKLPAWKESTLTLATISMIYRSILVLYWILAHTTAIQVTFMPDANGGRHDLARTQLFRLTRGPTDTYLLIVIPRCGLSKDWWDEQEEDWVGLHTSKTFWLAGTCTSFRRSRDVPILGIISKAQDHKSWSVYRHRSWADSRRWRIGLVTNWAVE